MLQHVLEKLAQDTISHLVFDDQSFVTAHIASRAINLLPTLKKLKVGSRPLAFCMPNSPELLSWHLACFYLGIVIIPIIYEHEPEFIADILAQTSPAILFTTTKKQQQLKNIPLPASTLQLNDFTTQQIPNTVSRVEASTVDDTETAFIIFSSGTVGQLKGIIHTYQSTYAFIEILSDILKVKSGLTYLIAQPMGHIGGIVTTLLTLLNAGTAILLPCFEINLYLAAATKYRPTHINLHTPLFYEIINYPDIDKSAFSRLVTCFASGDDTPYDLPQKFSNVTDAKMQTGYGSTETGIVMVNHNPYGKYSGSCGKKIAASNIKLLDVTQQTVAPNTTGEIWIQSPACCAGYWNMPDLNAKTFINGWFKSGDLAYQDEEGYYWYRGRDSQVIHRGQYQVYPAMIEQTLFTFPNIACVAVITQADMDEGEVPVAFIEMVGGVENPAELSKAILACAAAKLSAWEIPKKIIFVDKMPLNATGKIDRLALKKIFS